MGVGGLFRERGLLQIFKRSILKYFFAKTFNTVNLFLINKTGRLCVLFSLAFICSLYKNTPTGVKRVAQ